MVSLLIRTLILLNQGSTLMTSINLNFFIIPNIVTVQVRASAYELGERKDINIQFIVACMFGSFKQDP